MSVKTAGLPSWTTQDEFDEIESFMKSSKLFAKASPEDFFDPDWHRAHEIRTSSQAAALLQRRAESSLAADFLDGLADAPMATQLTPTLLACFNWDDLRSCPVRRQFMFLRSEIIQSHASASFDSLGELEDSPVPGLVHRYSDRVLLLATKTCPIYCGFCTRSYAVGPNTGAKSTIESPPRTRNFLSDALDYVSGDRGIRDVIISGGDIVNMHPDNLNFVLDRLLTTSHVRSVRLATRGLLGSPLQFAPDTPMHGIIVEGAKRAKSAGVELSLQVHFNCAAEINPIAKTVIRNILSECAITVRNQAVCMRGVNDSTTEVHSLIAGLVDIGISPYYVYQHDMVPGAEHLRTTIGETCLLEKKSRGFVAGFQFPRFVVDLPNGGGKRDVHSYDTYDESSGVAKYRSWATGTERSYVYHDPLR